jgi:hypothetical protein
MTDTANKLTALVRALAQQSARDAYAAAQGMNDKGSHNPACGYHRAATPALGDARGRNRRTPRFSPKVICDLDPNPPVSEAEVRLVAAMLGGVIDQILDPDRTD